LLYLLFELGIGVHEALHLIFELSLCEPELAREALRSFNTPIINPIDRKFRDVPSKIRDDERYWLYFKNCNGAIDRTLVPVKIYLSKQISYISRKGTHTQNVMAVCDFCMCFTFVWAGWEGTVHDTRIFWKLFERKNCDFHTHLEVCIQ
jgi:hypothetical protein